MSRRMLKGDDLALDVAQLRERQGQVGELLFQVGNAIAHAGQRMLKLALLRAVGVVEVDKRLDGGKRKPEPFAAQDQFQPRPVAIGVDARRAGAGRRQ